VTNREYWINALQHRYSDRFPLDLWIVAEPKQLLMEHYGVASFHEVERILGVTEMKRIHVDWKNPEWENRKDLRVLKSVSPYAGGRFVFHDERTFENEWGIVMRVGTTGRHDEWIRGPLSDAEVPDASFVKTPPREHLRYRSDLADHVAELKRSGEFTFIHVDNPFKRAWHLRGLENFLMDYYLNPDFVAGIYDRLVEREIPRLAAAVQAGVDLVKVVGDVAMQDRMIMGEELWRKYDKPALKKLLDACRKVNPDVFLFMHSDGDVSSIMGDLADDLGFHMINPLQPECMDLNWVKREFGDRIVMYGCVSLQRTLPFGTPDDVRKEVRIIIERYGQNGGLAVAPSNNIEIDTPAENIIAMCETVRDYFPFGD
jgi:uroporphyrinogen decarboxylase